jgi:hypothetical protein
MKYKALLLRNSLDEYEQEICEHMEELCRLVIRHNMLFGDCAGLPYSITCNDGHYSTCDDLEQLVNQIRRNEM